MTFNYKDYESLIYKIIYSFTKEKDLVEDLYQQGIIGLINAYNHYDSSFNVKFSTFAYQYIFGEIYRYYNNISHDFSINNNHLRLYKEIKRVKELLTQEYTKEPSPREIANYLGIAEEDVISNILIMQKSLSIDYEHDEMKLSDIICVSDNLDINVRDILSDLSEDQKMVIEFKYIAGYSQEEIARIMDKSQSTISRCEKDGILRIRSRITEDVYN